MFDPYEKPKFTVTKTDKIYCACGNKDDFTPNFKYNYLQSPFDVWICNKCGSEIVNIDRYETTH